MTYLLNPRAGFHPTRKAGRRHRTVICSFLFVAEWSSMEATSQIPMEVVLPKHILDIWVIVLITLILVYRSVGSFFMEGRSHSDQRNRDKGD